MPTIDEEVHNAEVSNRKSGLVERLALKNQHEADTRPRNKKKMGSSQRSSLSTSKRPVVSDEEYQHIMNEVDDDPDPFNNLPSPVKAKIQRVRSKRAAETQSYEEECDGLTQDRRISSQASKISSRHSEPKLPSLHPKENPKTLRKTLDLPSHLKDLRSFQQSHSGASSTLRKQRSIDPKDNPFTYEDDCTDNEREHDNHYEDDLDDDEDDEYIPKASHNRKQSDRFASQSSHYAPTVIIEDDQENLAAPNNSEVFQDSQKTRSQQPSRSRMSPPISAIGRSQRLHGSEGNFVSLEKDLRKSLPSSSSVASSSSSRQKRRNNAHAEEPTHRKRLNSDAEKIHTTSSEVRRTNASQDSLMPSEVFRNVPSDSLLPSESASQMPSHTSMSSRVHNIRSSPPRILIKPRRVVEDAVGDIKNTSDHSAQVESTIISRARRGKANPAYQELGPYIEEIRPCLKNYTILYEAYPERSALQDIWEKRIGTVPYSDDAHTLVKLPKALVNLLARLQILTTMKCSEIVHQARSNLAESARKNVKSLYRLGQHPLKIQRRVAALLKDDLYVCPKKIRKAVSKLKPKEKRPPLLHLCADEIVQLLIANYFGNIKGRGARNTDMFSAIGGSTLAFTACCLHMALRRLEKGVVDKSVKMDDEAKRVYFAWLDTWKHKEIESRRMIRQKNDRKFKKALDDLGKTAIQEKKVYVEVENEASELQRWYDNEDSSGSGEASGSSDEDCEGEVAVDDENGQLDADTTEQEA